jgi:Tol biopolymer transport system component
MIKHVLSLVLVAAVLPASASARADGGRIYFLRNLSIFALDPAGGAPTLVRAVDGCNVTALAVSPDGSRLADADNCGSGNQIKIAPAGGGDIQTLTSGGDAAPSFSPDGARIAFVRRSGST